MRTVTRSRCNSVRIKALGRKESGLGGLFHPVQTLHIHRLSQIRMPVLACGGACFHSSLIFVLCVCVFQVVRDAQSTSEEISTSFKRLSASSTGSTRSNHSASSLDMVPVRDTPSSSSLPSSAPGKPLILDLEQAMERLSRLQQAVESSVSLMMSFITGNWRSPAHLEGNLPAIHQAADRVRASVRDFLEFARGAVANAAQATDRLLQSKLGRQVGKMEDVFQNLIRHSQSLDTVAWSAAALAAPPPGGDDLDRLVMTARGIPDDTKQLASFLHGNATLLFKRTNRQQQQLPLPPIPAEISGHMTGSGSGSYQGGEKVNIQSRPLPSPPKFTAAEEEEGVERPYESTEEGWMEDYDYVHLQVRTNNNTNGNAPSQHTNSSPSL